MKFTLKIESAGAALAEDPELEVARLLKEAAAKVEGGRTSGSLLDYNGNTVGRFELKV